LLRLFLKPKPKTPSEIYASSSSPFQQSPFMKTRLAGNSYHSGKKWQEENCFRKGGSSFVEIFASQLLQPPVQCFCPDPLKRKINKSFLSAANLSFT